jgi:hypothetical protein
MAERKTLDGSAIYAYLARDGVTPRAEADLIGIKIAFF